MDNNNSDKPQYVKTDQPGLVRDTFSQAIISTDHSKLSNYRRRASLLKENQNKIESINTVKEDLNNLKEEMAEIKSLLLQIVSKEK